MGLRTYPWEAPEHEQERAWRLARGRGRRVLPARTHVRGLLAGGARPGVGHGLLAEVLHARLLPS